MERVYWRRPGVLVLLAYLMIAMLATFSGWMLIRVTTGWEPHLFAAWVVGMALWVALGKLHTAVTRRRVPVCPHCGADTDLQFRICRTCGRVKNQTAA